VFPIGVGTLGPRQCLSPFLGALEDLPFAAGREILRDLTGVLISEEDFRLISEELGGELHALEEEQAEDGEGITEVRYDLGHPQAPEVGDPEKGLDIAHCFSSRMWTA